MELERGPRAFRGRTITAGTGRLDDNGLALAHQLTGRLDRQYPRAVAADLDKATRSAAAAPENAPWLVDRPFHGAVERTVVPDRPDCAAQSHSPPIAAGPAGVLDQSVALDQQRVFHLDRFHRQVRCVGDVNLNPIGAVLLRALRGALRRGRCLEQVDGA